MSLKKTVCFIANFKYNYVMAFEKNLVWFVTILR